MMERKLKDSGIPWIGLIPEHWVIGKIKKIFNIFSGATPKSDNPDFWDGNIAWVTPADFKTEQKIVSKGRKSITQAGYDSCGTILLPKDSIIFSKRAPIGSVVISANSLCTNQGCLGCVAKKDCIPKYYYFLFSVLDKTFATFGTGTTFMEISYSDFGNFSIPIPPLEEQERIASCLDTKCGEIDELIDVEQQMIAELEAYRQAVITEAVTHGLNPDAPLRETNFPILPVVPSNWELSRIGLHFTLILGKMLCSKQLEPTYKLAPYFCAANVHFRELDKFNLKRMWFSPSEMEQYIVKNGDVLIVEGGAGAGGCCVVNNLDTPVFIQNSIIIAREQKNVNSRFLSYYIESLVKRGYIELACNRATFSHFTKEKVANTPLPIPPLSEQLLIADYLDAKCAEIDELMKVKQEKIESLKQYRQSIIFEAVTGKTPIN